MTEKVSIEQVNSPEGRTYIVGGDRKYFSVTTPFQLITAPALEVWKIRIGERAANRIAQKAAAYGTAVHKYCEMVNKKELKCPGDIRDAVVEKDQRITADVVKYLGWYHENIEEVIHTEEKVFNDDIMVAGTLDLLARLKTGKLAVLDIKTGKIKPLAEMQLATYRVSAAKTFGIKLEDIQECGVISILKTRQVVRGIYYGQADEAYEAYKHLVELYRFYLQRDPPKKKKELK